MTLDVQGPPPPSAAALKAATGNGGVIPAHLMLSAEENKPSLRFELYIFDHISLIKILPCEKLVFVRIVLA